MQGCGFKDNAGGKRVDWPKGLEQLGTTWPDLDELSTYLATSPAQVSGYRNTRTASGHRGEF